MSEAVGITPPETANTIGKTSLMDDEAKKRENKCAHKSRGVIGPKLLAESSSSVWR